MLQEHFYVLYFHDLPYPGEGAMYPVFVSQKDSKGSPHRYKKHVM